MVKFEAIRPTDTVWLTYRKAAQALRFFSRRFRAVPSLLRNYLNIVMLGRPRLRMIELSLLYECNFRCSQCSAADSIDPRRRELTFADYRNIIDEAVGLGAIQINITGGEPLLEKELLYKVIAYIRRKGRLPHLVSNSFLMTDEILDRLSALGLQSLESGVDSADPETHDANRGEPGSLTKIMQVTRQARRRGIDVIWNTIITKEKIRNQDMERLAALSKQYGAILHITPPCVTGRWKGQKEILLDESGRRYLIRFLRRYGHARTDIYSSYTGLRCSAGREKLALTPYGDVIPCPLIQIKYGNVREDSLGKIWGKMLRQRFYHSQVKGCLSSFDEEFIAFLEGSADTTYAG